MSPTTRRQFLARAGALSAAASVGWPLTGAAHAARLPTPLASRADVRVPTCAELRDTGPLQRRDLSLPHSRIVLNPLNFNSQVTPLHQASAHDLSVGVGYYAADQVATLPRLLSVYERPAGAPSPPAEPEVTWSDGFDTVGPDWQADRGLQVESTGNDVRLTVTRTSPVPWGALSQWLEIDLDTYDELRVTVPEAVGLWAVKVNDGRGGSDRLIKAEDTRTGTVAINLRQATGWTGIKRFRLRIFVVTYDAPVTVDDVRILSATKWLRAPQTSELAWLPHELAATASYQSGMRVEVSDHFNDVNSIVRSVRVVEPAAGGERLSLTGRYAGQVTWDPGRRILTVTAAQHVYAVAIAGTAEPAFYTSLANLHAGVPSTTGPGASGTWEVVVDPGTLRQGLACLAVGFATPHEGGAAVAVQRAITARSRAPIARGLQERAWNAKLAKVPHPLDFELRGVPANGVTADDVRRSYYAGWIFCHANILPPQPEIGFEFPQMPAGKPSRWMEGKPGARPTAMWDSVLGMQLLGYVDPESAWATFEGLCSLVDDDGAIGGESLPTRFADTAMILYQLTGDTDRLRRIYPAVRRHVLWARDNPRWIHKEHDFTDERDAGFAFCVLIDLAYLRDVAIILGNTEDAEFFDAERVRYRALCEQWFWTTPTADPHEFFFEEGSHDISPGNPLWIGLGLHVDLWDDDSPFVAGLLRRLMGIYRPTAAYAGMFQVKYPDLALTSYGLLDRGHRDVATVLMNANAREAVRSNSFAETYVADPPRGAGVRPSMFGLGQLLCTVLLNNGFRFDLGWPAVVRMTEDGGGVVGLTVRGKSLDVVVPAGSSTVELGGTLLKTDPECRELDVALGQTVPVPTECSTR